MSVELHPQAASALHKTIFASPWISGLMHRLSVRALRWLGWQVEGELPPGGKCVLIVAPHTSNWDFPIGLMVCFALRLEAYWMGKHTLFPPLLGGLMRWLGGIPVDRSRAGNLVATTIAAFAQCERLVVAIPPEGTRSRVSRWKTGFYHIACGAGVPIALGFIDFGRKTAGLKGAFVPTGDIEADLPKIQAVYAGIVGKNPQQFAAGRSE